MFCVLQIYPVDKVGAQHYSWEEFVEKISVDEYEDGEDLSPFWKSWPHCTNILST